jgi:hypothetical protein
MASFLININMEASQHALIVPQKNATLRAARTDPSLHKRSLRMKFYRIVKNLALWNEGI